MIPQDPTEKVACAFWSKTRRVFVPCTSTDIATRTGYTLAKSADILESMTRAELVTAKNNSNFHTYDLTQKGRDLVEGSK